MATQPGCCAVLSSLLATGTALLQLGGQGSGLCSMTQEVDETAVAGGEAQVLAGGAACPAVGQGEHRLPQVKPWLGLMNQPEQSGAGKLSVCPAAACTRGACTAHPNHRPTLAGKRH